MSLYSMAPITATGMVLRMTQRKAVLLVSVMFVSYASSRLTGSRLADYPPPDFRQTFSMSAQEGRQSFREIKHNLNSLPFLVRVHSAPRIGDSAGYHFEGIGACQNSGEKGNYGGLLFGYSSESVRIWAPSEYRGNENGRIVFVGDGWGGEKYTESAVATDVTVEAWRDGPEPTFQTEVEVDSRRETFYEIKHDLNQLPEIVSIRISSLRVAKGKAFYFHGVSSAQNPSHVRQYGGVIFSYSEDSVRLWFPDKGSKKGKNGCIVISRGWGGGVHSDELSSSTCRVEIRLWVNLFPSPVFQTDWIGMQANVHNESFLEVSHNLGKLPLYVQVQARVTLTGSQSIKQNYIFEGSGSVQATQFSRAKSYGGVLYAYNTDKVRVWIPSSESLAAGKIVSISGGWGSGKMDMVYERADIRIRVFADICDGSTQAIDSQGICRDASNVELSLQLSKWKKCSNTCGKGKSRRYGTGCHGRSLRPVLQCSFDENDCGFVSEESLEYQLQWKRSRGLDALKKTADKSMKYEPSYGYPKGSYFMYTTTYKSKAGSVGILLSPPIASGTQCRLRFFYTSAVYFGAFYVEVLTADGNWHEVWKALDSQTGNPQAWFSAYINIYTLLKEPINRFKFVHEMPERCQGSCAYHYVAVDLVNLECVTESHDLIPLKVCKAKELPFPGCPMEPSNIAKKGPAFSTVVTKEGVFIKAARNKSDLIAQYQFNVVKRGKYYLWVEGFGQSKQDNGVQVRVDSYSTYGWNFIFRNDSPVWNVFTVGYTLDPGIHTVTILQYELGFKFRNLMISPESLSSWSDLGMQSHHISDHMLTSSLYTMTLREEAQFSRLHGLGGWWPRDENAGALYLQIRLPDLALINKIATQGGYSLDPSYPHHCRTESFKVKFSLDGKNYAYYRGLTVKKYIFSGNLRDFSAVKTHNLSYAVPARGVRFYPWKFPLYPCLRVELYGKYITDGMCEHIEKSEPQEKDCFGDRECGKNAMCQRSEKNDPNEEETCRCVSGYHGDKCQHAGCTPNPCHNNGVCRILKGKFKCLCPPGYYGQTCLLQCPEDTYGIDCSKSCKCRGYSKCNHITGECSCKPGYLGANCTTPCEDGYYGEACKHQCSCGTLPVCDHTTGNCYCQLGLHGKKCNIKCPEFYFGKNCTERCQCVNDASCHGHNGQCTCKPGWRGTQCELACPDGTYGTKCQKKCSCPKNANCNHISGNCTCKAGWIGPNCTQPCPLGNYGHGCKLPCHCNWEHTQSCHPGHGACNCLPGYTGGNCSAKCPADTYGIGCSKTCRCINDARCDHVTGSCNCLIGYMGKFCEKRCKVGYYGYKCKSRCKCLVNQTEECDFKTGECNCIAGYRGDRCHRTCKKGTWGKNCGNKCQCLNNGTCEGVHGLCYCAPGWEGMMCGKQCIQNFYGPDCKYLCKCKNDAFCDRFNGSCTCTPGFKGQFCQSRCQQGTYGPYCKFKCACNKIGTANCDIASGSCFCKLGWYGTNCEKECQDGFYGQDCAMSCFPCRHVSGPCNKQNGDCNCAPGFVGRRCEDDCDNEHFGQRCHSKCSCGSNHLCNSIDGSCFSEKFAAFYLAFYDRLQSMQTVINKRLLRVNVEKFMEKYYATVSSRLMLNRTSSSTLRSKRAVQALLDGIINTRLRRRSAYIKDNTSVSDSRNTNPLLYKKGNNDTFVARVINFREVIDSQQRDATEVELVVFRNSVPMNGSLASAIFKAVVEEDVISVLRYSYFAGPVFNRQQEKNGSFKLLWIISGATVGLALILLIIIVVMLYKRRQSTHSPIYKVKRNSKDYEMKPCLPGTDGHVLAFDNPYYDVIAAMGLDDDIEEDYHNPLYPLYDDSSYYGEGHESESGTEIPGEEIYRYQYDRDSGISSGTF